MKKITALCAAILAGLAAVAGMDLTGFIAVLPPEFATFLVIVPSLAAAIVHFVGAVRNAAEDAKNLPGPPVLVAMLAVTAALALPACGLANLSVTAEDERWLVRVEHSELGRIYYYTDRRNGSEFRVSSVGEVWLFEIKDPASGLWLVYDTGPKGGLAVNLPPVP